MPTLKTLNTYENSFTARGDFMARKKKVVKEETQVQPVTEAAAQEEQN